MKLTYKLMRCETVLASDSRTIKRLRLYKNSDGYCVDLNRSSIERFPLTIKGYYDALRLFKETLEFEASEALK